MSKIIAFDEEARRGQNQATAQCPTIAEPVHRRGHDRDDGDGDDGKRIA